MIKIFSIKYELPDGAGRLNTYATSEEEAIEICKRQIPESYNHKVDKTNE